MHKILIAHSDKKIIDLYQPYLSRHFNLDSATNGLAAIRKIRFHRPVAIISDYHLPLLSGLSLLKFVRAQQQLAGVPFLFLTDHEDLSEALSAGANEWIQRSSASPDLLLERIFYQLKQRHV